MLALCSAVRFKKNQNNEKNCNYSWGRYLCHKLSGGAVRTTEHWWSCSLGTYCQWYFKFLKNLREKQWHQLLGVPWGGQGAKLIHSEIYELVSFRSSQNEAQPTWYRKKEYPFCVCHGDIFCRNSLFFSLVKGLGPRYHLNTAVQYWMFLTKKLSLVTVAIFLKYINTLY